MTSIYSSNNDIIEGFNETIEDLRLKLNIVPDIPNCLQVIVSGYIDTYNAPTLQRQLNKIVDAGYINIILDAEELTYLSSTGIGALVNLLKSLKSLNGNLVIAKMKMKVQEILKLLGFSTFFDFTDTLEDAINFIKQNKGMSFVRTINCPGCGVKLRFTKAGKFRCGACKTSMELGEEGQIKRLL